MGGDPQLVRTIIVMSLVLGTGIIIVLAISWAEYRKHLRSLDILRVYAERREEPPASVVEALTALSGRPPYAPRWPRPRSWHLSHIAANAVFTVGFAGVAWWHLGETGEAGKLVIVCIFAALFFAAAIAAQLVGAYYARER